MTATLRRSPDSPPTDPDFCVVATRLNRQTRSTEPPGAFPDLRRNLRHPSSARIPLFRIQCKGKAGENVPVPIRVAPFAGQMHINSIKCLDSSPDKADSNRDGVGSSKDRSATGDSSAADGDSPNSDSCCSKSAGRASDTSFTKERDPLGRTMGPTSARTAPKPMDDRDKAPPKPSPAREAEDRRATGLEAVSEDVLVQICDYLQERDIVRLSTVSPTLFNDKLWEQLHLVRFGLPNNACLKDLPFARASRLQLQSDFPIHHARLCAIRSQHGRIRPTLEPERSCCPRLMFAAEALTREDQSLREEEQTIRLERADCRRKQHTTRASLLRDMAVAKRASTNESMAMVDMRSAVERHSYAPGCRPRAPQEASSWREGHVGRRGKAKGTSRIVPPSLSGVFGEALPNHGSSY